MCLTIAVPFDRGVLLASSHRVAKMPWGLVAGRGVVTGFERAFAEFGVARTPELIGVQDELEHLWRGLCAGRAGGRGTSAPAPADPPTSDKPSWLFSYEDVETNGPIVLYRDLGDGPAATGWGWVLLSRPAAEDPSNHVKDVLREGELRLQWDLDRGLDFNMRLESLKRAFAWFGSVWEWLGVDTKAGVEVGIHEPGHQYSVDRVGVGQVEG